LARRRAALNAALRLAVDSDDSRREPSHQLVEIHPVLDDGNDHFLDFVVA